MGVGVERVPPSAGGRGARPRLGGRARAQPALRDAAHALAELAFAGAEEVVRPGDLDEFDSRVDPGVAGGEVGEGTEFVALPLQEHPRHPGALDRGAVEGENRQPHQHQPGEGLAGGGHGDRRLGAEGKAPRPARQSREAFGRRPEHGAEIGVFAAVPVEATPAAAHAPELEAQDGHAGGEQPLAGTEHDSRVHRAAAQRVGVPQHAHRRRLSPARRPKARLEGPDRSGNEQLHGGRMDRTGPRRHPRGVVSRTLALFTARLAALLSGDAAPTGALLLHGALAAGFALLLRGGLSPFAYTTALFSLSAALVALSLLGEFGGLLRADPAEEWIGAQPIGRRELAAARVLLALGGLVVLALGMLVPAALLAPGGTGMLARAGIVGAGLLQALTIAALLLVLEVLPTGRAAGLLVVLQAGLVGALVVGMLAAPRWLAALAGLPPQAHAPAWLVALPPAWFAALAGLAHPPGLPPPALAAGASLGALVLLVSLPPPRAASSPGRASVLERPLAPLFRLALRGWVRPAEAGAFQLVWQALPRERDFVLRAYPMLGIPLALLWLAAGRDHDPATLDWLAVLCWTPAVYLPVLLAHLPATRAPRASWLLACAPLTRASIDAGARKAVLLRFVLPLHTLLTAMVCALASPRELLAPAIQGLFVSALALRALFPRFVLDLPLSVPPERIEVRQKLFGIVPALAVALPVAAILSRRAFSSPPAGAALASGLCTLEIACELAVRRGGAYPASDSSEVR